MPTEFLMDSGSDGDGELFHLDKDDEPVDHRAERAYTRSLRDKVTLHEVGYEEDRKRSNSLGTANECPERDSMEGVTEDLMAEGRLAISPSPDGSHLKIGQPHTASEATMCSAPSPKKVCHDNRNNVDNSADIVMDSGSEGDRDEVNQFDDEEDEVYNIHSERKYARRLRKQITLREKRYRKQRKKNDNLGRARKCVKNPTGTAVAEASVANGHKAKDEAILVSGLKEEVKAIGEAVADAGVVGAVKDGLTCIVMTKEIEVGEIDGITDVVMVEEILVGAVENVVTNEFMVEEIEVGAVEEVLTDEAMSKARVVAVEDGIIDALMIETEEDQLTNEVMARKIVVDTGENKEVQKQKGIIMKGTLKDALRDEVTTEVTLAGEGENKKELEYEGHIETGAVKYALSDELTAEARTIISDSVSVEVMTKNIVVGIGEKRATEGVIEEVRVSCAIEDGVTDKVMAHESLVDAGKYRVTEENMNKARVVSAVEEVLNDKAMSKDMILCGGKDRVTEKEVEKARELSVKDGETDKAMTKQMILGAGQDRATDEVMDKEKVEDTGKINIRRKRGRRKEMEARAVSAGKKKVTDEVMDKQIGETRDLLADLHLSLLMAEDTMVGAGDESVTDKGMVDKIVKNGCENNQAQEYVGLKVSCAVNNEQNDKILGAIKDKVSDLEKDEQKENLSTKHIVTVTGQDEQLEQPILAQKDNDDVFSWSEDFSTFTGQEETYLRSPGPKIGSQDPVELFMAIWNKNILKTIVKETNNYAWQVITKMSEKENGIPNYLRDWTETDVPEMYRYFALIILMTFCYRSKVRDYWTTNILQAPELRNIMSKNRFSLISKFLHFVNNNSIDPGLSSYDKKIFKIRPILDHCNSKFTSLYIPNKHLSLDESLLLWKGNLSWTQSIRTKAARFGIKSFELCEAVTGYQLRCLLYAGKDSTMSEKPINGFENCTAKVVLELMDGFLDVGHTLVMDNWYNQLSLTRFLKTRRTDVIGTMNPRRVNVPEDIKQAQDLPLAKWKQIARHCGDISLVAWRDVKLVTVISTYHANSRVTVQRRNAEVEMPAAIQDYNKYMGGVDSKDQKLAMFLMERKRGKKWYMKVFKRLLNTSLLNAYIIYSRTPTLKPLSHRDFRYEVAVGLLQKFRVKTTGPPPPETPIATVLDKDMRRLMKADHFVESTQKVPGSNRSKQIRCVRCTAARRRTMVTLICSFCKVALCPGPCWAEYHTLKNLKISQKPDAR